MRLTPREGLKQEHILSLYFSQESLPYTETATITLKVPRPDGPQATGQKGKPTKGGEGSFFFHILPFFYIPPPQDFNGPGFPPPSKKERKKKILWSNYLSNQFPPSPQKPIFSSLDTIPHPPPHNVKEKRKRNPFQDLNWNPFSRFSFSSSPLFKTGKHVWVWRRWYRLQEEGRVWRLKLSLETPHYFVVETLWEIEMRALEKSRKVGVFLSGHCFGTWLQFQVVAQSIKVKYHSIFIISPRNCLKNRKKNKIIWNKGRRGEADGVEPDWQEAEGFADAQAALLPWGRVGVGRAAGK